MLIRVSSASASTGYLRPAAGKMPYLDLMSGLSSNSSENQEKHPDSTIQPTIRPPVKLAQPKKSDYPEKTGKRRKIIFQ
jgi:hypothetical protein